MVSNVKLNTKSKHYQNDTSSVYAQIQSYCNGKPCGLITPKVYFQHSLTGKCQAAEILTNKTSSNLTTEVLWD